MNEKTIESGTKHLDSKNSKQESEKELTHAHHACAYRITDNYEYKIKRKAVHMPHFANFTLLNQVKIQSLAMDMTNRKSVYIQPSHI